MLVPNPDTILAMGNLAFIYSDLGKYAEAEKLEIQVLDASSKIQTSRLGNIMGRANPMGKIWGLLGVQAQVDGPGCSRMHDNRV